MSVRSLVFGKITTICCPNRLLFYNTNIRHSIITQTSIIQFHFIHTIKTTRQPLNHHTFCTPLTRHQHCSVNMVFTTPIIQFSTVIGFKIPFHHQNLFKTGFNLIYIVIKNHSILPYHFPIPSLQHSNSIPSLQLHSITPTPFHHSNSIPSLQLHSITPTPFHHSNSIPSLQLHSITPTPFHHSNSIPTLKRSSKKVFCPDCIFVSIPISLFNHSNNIHHLTTSKPQPLPDGSSMFSL